MLVTILIFCAGLATGFLLCLFCLRPYIRQVRQLARENLAFQKTEKRLVNALRYSGARIAFYKSWNKKHLATILAYQNREIELRNMLLRSLAENETGSGK